MRNVQWSEYAKNLWQLAPIQDITDQLPSRNTDDDPGVRRIEDITHLSIHHSGSEGQGPYQYADWHVTNPRGNKWHRIGYTFVIGESGTFQTNDVLRICYHTGTPASGKFHNKYSIGICCSGNFTARDMPQFQRNQLYALILTLMDLFPNIQTVEHIKGHREYEGNETTECPAIDMRVVRQDVQGQLAKMQYALTTGSKKSVAFSIANQILYLANLANGKNPDGSPTTPGITEWALNMLVDLKPFMDEKGLL